MKEYKTLQVSPEDEGETIIANGKFGWKLEDTREVYNESQEVLGVEEKVTSYGSFMRGFTGNDGKIESQVRTRTVVTHYLSMRFSRDTCMKNYDRLLKLEEKFNNPPSEPEYLPLKEQLPCKSYVHATKPIFGTVLNFIVVLASVAVLVYLLLNESTRSVGWAIAIDIGLPLVALIWTAIIVSRWKRYKKIHPQENEINAEIDKENEEIDKLNRIIDEENKEIENKNKKIKEDFESLGDRILKEAREILTENGIEV